MIVTVPVVYQPYSLVYRPTVVAGSPFYVPPCAPVFSVQRRLAALEYYAGPNDDIMGPKTRGAISTYQREHGLVVTGTINKTLVKSLKLSNRAQSAVASATAAMEDGPAHSRNPAEIAASEYAFPFFLPLARHLLCLAT